MKNLRLFSILALAVVLFTSCNRDKRSSRPIASGKPYEIVVVASPETWDSQLGDSLRGILEENIPVFNSSEPMYEVVRILPSGFQGVTQRHRNIIIVNVGSQYETPSILAQYDTYSAPQLIVRVVGPDIRSATEYVSEHRSELVAVFEIAERNRDLDLNKRHPDRTLNRKVSDRFGFEITFNDGFVLHEKNKLPDSVMWISREYPFSSQGVIIYSYPFTGPEDFTVESLVARRNEFAKLIPGENEGSHMITVEEFVPLISHKRINGRYWAEMRGFWEVYKDFMGGPFVSYSTLDTEKNRVVTLDFYVYSPDFHYPRRGYYRNLQHLIYGISFPGDKERMEALEAAEILEEGAVIEAQEDIE